MTKVNRPTPCYISHTVESSYDDFTHKRWEALSCINPLIFQENCHFGVTYREALCQVKVSRKVKWDKMWSINSLAARLNSINTNFIYQRINKYSRKDELSHIASAVPKHTNQSLLTSKNKKKPIFKQSRHFHIIQKNAVYMILI